MISFSKLGKHEGLGNQLFQYAFLRTTAQRLGVKFYCPPWLGDKIFLLKDEALREITSVNLPRTYRQPENNGGFSECALAIEDGTEIFGFFQSEKYFDEKEVRRWYTFKEDAIAAVKQRFKHIDFSRSTAVHLRFGDMKKYPMFVIMPPSYYSRALSYLRSSDNILVFSDEIDTAKGHLRGLGRNFVYIEGNQNHEDL